MAKNKHVEKSPYDVLGHTDFKLIQAKEGEATFSFLVTTPSGHEFIIRDCHEVGNSIFGKWPDSDEETEIFTDGVTVSKLRAETEQRWRETAALKLVKKAAAKLADKMTPNLDGSSEQLERLIKKNDLVLAVFNDAQEIDGYGIHVIKGDKYLDKIVLYAMKAQRILWEVNKLKTAAFHMERDRAIFAQNMWGD